MYFQHIEQFRRAGEKALGFYGLDGASTLVLLHRSENATFLVTGRTENRPRAVMRVSRPGYRTLEEIQAEMRWLLKIAQEKVVTIAHPICCLDGSNVACVKAGGQEYYCVLCEYLEGEAPDPEDGERGFLWFQKTGEAAAKLHLQTVGWEEGRHLDRPVWDYEALLGPSGFFGDWRACGQLNREERAFLETVCETIRRRLLEYGREETRFGLIHSDLRASNLLTEGNAIKVLDFDDCGYGWHLFDLAASFSFIEDHPSVPGWIEAWLKGYTSVRSLTERDYGMIPTFLMARRLQLLGWVTSHSDSDPVWVRDRGFAKRTFRMAERYMGQTIPIQI